MTSNRTILCCTFLLLLTCGASRALIIPEELPSLLSIIYSNIPPIKNGFDSRFGLGFRLGQHADVQLLTEIGPQIETQPLGGTSERRRSATAPPDYVYSKISSKTKFQEDQEGKPPTPDSWLAKWHRSTVQNLRLSSKQDDIKANEPVDQQTMEHLSKLFKQQ